MGLDSVGETDVGNNRFDLDVPYVNIHSVPGTPCFRDTQGLRHSQ
jgi:hypothetical protein